MSHSSLIRLGLVLAAALVAAPFGCRPASYEIIKPNKKKDHPVTDAGDPRTIEGPDRPVDTGGSNGKKPLVTGNVPPTARVEVVWNGSSVTRVRVGAEVRIRPSTDTVDPDDLGVNDCANPGIVKANYTIAEGTSPSADRRDDHDCSTLAVPYNFSRPGDYEIGMIVTSNEDEHASASMILHVVQDGDPIDADDGGFTIYADPMLAGKGQAINFVGICDTEKAFKITWTFADGAKGAGIEIKHAYAKIGQYRVAATCTETVTSGRTWVATITVVVIAKPVILPGGPGTRPIPPVRRPPVTPPIDQNPGNPGQGHPGQGNPGQGKPGQIEPGQCTPCQELDEQVYPWG